MFIEKNELNLNSMEWAIEGRDIWGDPTCYVAFDDFWYNNKQNRMFIRYNVGYMVTAKEEKKFYVFVQFPDCPFRAEVSSFEEGKKLASQKRKQYWESLLHVIINQMFNN